MQSGLVTCLNRFPDLRVSATADTLADALKILTDRSIAIDVIFMRIATRSSCHGVIRSNILSAG